MIRSLLFPFLLFSFFAPIAAQEKTPFDMDSAYARLTHLVERIGPRPMGSPAEREAITYAVEQFQSYGLGEAYAMMIRMTPPIERNSGGVNTNSGVAVGVKRGKTSRTIVLGAHLDTAGPENVGANDNGSGTATILELARVLAQKETESTIVFAIFGGEEEGLIGSRHFVSNYPGMDDVVLMLQVDMANGLGWLIPLLESRGVYAPEWLVKALYEEQNRLGYAGLDYPTFFNAFQSGTGGAIGSDHQPFLDRGIPAIDITTDLNDPIHSQQDNLNNFRKEGLKRSGDLMYALVERFDGGVPEKKTAQYFLMDTFGWPLFIPYWVLYLLVFAAVGTAVLALFKVRERRPRDENGVLTETRGNRPTIPSLKVSFLLFFITFVAVSAGPFLGLIAGVRHFWYSFPMPYMLFTVMAGLCAAIFALRWSRRMHFSKDPYRYLLPATVWLFVITALTLFASVQIASAFATGLLLISLAHFVQAPVLRLALVLLAPYAAFRLFFNEGYWFFARMVAMLPVEGLANSAFQLLFYSTGVFLLSVPFALGFAAAHFDTQGKFAVIGKLRSSYAMAGTIFCLTVFGIWTLMTPAYSDRHAQVIKVDQMYIAGDSLISVAIKSGEFLRNAEISLGSTDTVMRGWTQSALKKVKLTDQTNPSTWMRVARTIDVSGDSSRNISIMTVLSFQHRPYSLRVTYSTGDTLEEISSPLRISSSSRRATIAFYSFPEKELTIPVFLKIGAKDTVITESIEAVFVETPVAVMVKKPFSEILQRTRYGKEERIPLR